MNLQFIGCGDAFGSGGRFNTCFHVRGMHTNFLIDCGASSLISLKKYGVDLNQIQAIFITHFHADHFGGIPFFILESQFFSKRETSLVIAGPKGLNEWYERVMETSFPGSSKTKNKFSLELVELEVNQPAMVAGVEVIPFQAHHGPANGPFFSIRLTAEGKTITYTGDTEWTEDLIQAAKDADLFIAEAYFFDKKITYHLNLATIQENLSRMQPKRLILTHMSQDMLSRIGQLSYETAADGMIVSV